MENDDKLNYIENEIERRKRLPKTLRKSINDIIFQNLITAAILTGYFCIVDIMFFVLSSTQFENFLKYFSLIMVAVTIVTFEIAYKRNSKKFLSFGVEFLLSGILSLYIPFIYLHTNVATRFVVMIVPAILVGYYLVKSFLIFKRKQIQYRSENLSDVKEMMRYTEDKGYLDEKSTKTYKAKQEEEKKLKKIITEEQKLRKKRKLEKR